MKLTMQLDTKNEQLLRKRMVFQAYLLQQTASSIGKMETPTLVNVAYNVRLIYNKITILTKCSASRKPHLH
jgi:hypothetical protein